MKTISPLLGYLMKFISCIPRTEINLFSPFLWNKIDWTWLYLQHQQWRAYWSMLYFLLTSESSEPYPCSNLGLYEQKARSSFTPSALVMPGYNPLKTLVERWTFCDINLHPESSPGTRMISNPCCHHTSVLTNKTKHLSLVSAPQQDRLEQTRELSKRKFPFQLPNIRTYLSH